MLDIVPSLSPSPTCPLFLFLILGYLDCILRESGDSIYPHKHISAMASHIYYVLGSQPHRRAADGCTVSQCLSSPLLIFWQVYFTSIQAGNWAYGLAFSTVSLLSVAYSARSNGHASSSYFLYCQSPTFCAQVLPIELISTICDFLAVWLFLILDWIATSFPFVFLFTSDSEQIFPYSTYSRRTQPLPTRPN